MKKNKFLVLVTLCITCFSCTKDSTTNQPPAAVPYMSITENSTWQFQLTDNIKVKTTNYSLTSTTKPDTAIGGKQYHIFTNSTSGLSEYYSILGSDYYNYRDLGVSFSSAKLEILYLKDNLKKGDTWQQSFTLDASGFPIPVTISNKIEEKGISRTVNGIAYSNVINVSSTIASSFIPADKLVTSINNYYTPKYGVIESTYNIKLNYPPLVNNIDTKTILLSADIK